MKHNFKGIIVFLSRNDTLTHQHRASCFLLVVKLVDCRHAFRVPLQQSSRIVHDIDPRRFGWKRPHGVPSTRWIDLVDNDQDQLVINQVDLTNLTQDTTIWRPPVNLLGSAHSFPLMKTDADRSTVLHHF